MLTFSKKNSILSIKLPFLSDITLSNCLNDQNIFHERWPKVKKKIFSFKSSLSIFPIQKDKKMLILTGFEWITFDVIYCHVPLYWIEFPEKP